MNKPLQNLIFILLFVFGFATCEKETNLDYSVSDLQYISYGTSFGECIGYCRNSVIVSETKIDFTKTGWSREELLPDIMISEITDKVYWQTLIDELDTKAFLQLDSIIGCPDCVDGGAEWIELRYPDKSHKVTFGYRDAPEIVKPFVSYLRAYMNAFQIDNDNAVDFNNRTLIDQRGRIQNFVATRGRNQYLIRVIAGNDTSYYYPEYLDAKYQENDLEIVFNGVLKYDSTTIYKPAPNDVPVPDFKARNINVYGTR